MTDLPADVLLCAEGVRKRFGATTALDGVDLRVHGGEVHALIGENGAGKSTLMNILAGVHRPDGGAIRLLGAPYTPRDPDDARRRGVAMIHQEPALCPHLTVEQNVMLGRERTILGWVGRRAMRPAIRAAFARLGHAIPLDARVASLGAAERQLVEIARALALGGRVLIMDEPTSSLARKDAARLFAVIRDVASAGAAVIYISHFIEEITAIATRFTVLRDGRSVASGDVATTPAAALLDMMAGREVTAQRARTPRAPGGRPLLRVDGLRGARLPRRASFDVHAGEVFGICGLVGAGRTETLRAIFGLDAVRGGSVAREGRAAMLSEDRRGEGLAGGLSIATNVTLSRLAPVSRLGFVRAPLRQAAATRWIQALGIRCRDPGQPVRELSGGNQQKVALARLLHEDADVLLLDEPTQGIDVGARAAIHDVIAGLAARGKAIVLATSHVPEALAVCDRIAVMSRGVLGPARAAAEWTEDAILAAATAGVADG